MTDARDARQRGAGGPRARLDDAPSTRRGFLIDLYREHLQLASFLYEQAAVYRENPELAWTDVGEVEARSEAHLDALVLGGDLAVDVCREGAETEDAGELHAAVRVFARQDRGDLVRSVADRLDGEPWDDGRGRALADALCWEYARSQAEELATELARAGESSRAASPATGSMERSSARFANRW
jgi:hypothetical protein